MSPEAQIPEAITGGTVGEPVLEVPMVLDHAIDVTPTPHASDAFIGDSSRSLSRAPLSGFRGRAIALGLGVLGTIGVGGFGSASAQDATEPPRTEDPNATVKPVETGTPEPGGSVAPSEDPITGVLPSCPPEASPSPVVSPSPTPVILAFVNNEGQNVNVTLADQELPSAPPSEDPETAAIDCDPEATATPKTSLEPSAPPSAPPSAEPKPDRTLSPEEISKITKNSVVKEFLKLKDKPITEEDFFRILEDSSLEVSEFYRAHGIGYYTPEELFNDEKGYYEKFRKNWDMETEGHKIATKAVYSLKFAQQAVDEGDWDMAKLFETKAEAIVRIGKSKIKFEESPAELDNAILELAKGIGIK